MNIILFNNILNYDLDGPFSEYTFSIRLASENNWTKIFTDKAILEYKKFMYLAATANAMVSPSEIVDIVWHQHLIFTQSYKEFCNILGKQIQHIPSTHNREEFEKFKQAKERTTQLYEAAFGEQPSDIWEKFGMYDSLNLEKSSIQLNRVLTIGIIGSVLLSVPTYFLLQPVFKAIGNPDFLLWYIGFAAFLFMVLEIFNRDYLSGLLKKVDKDAFLLNLHPLELIFSKSKNISTVINGVVNQLVLSKQIDVSSDFKLSKSKNRKTALSTEMKQVMEVVKTLGKTHYPNILKSAAGKPVFQNISKSITTFQAYFNNSKAFISLFILNFVTLSLLFIFGLTRFITGFMAEKPIIFIMLTLLVFVVMIVLFLNRLTHFFIKKTIPNSYKKERKQSRETSDDYMDWEWDYFLLESAVLAPAFIPIVDYVDEHSNNNGGSCGTSCGSSCGSSCGGGSCGGGCGGCGG